MSGIQQTVIKVKAASVRMSNNVVCNTRCLVVRKLSVCFAVFTFHRSLGVGYVNFFKPTYWTFGGATYSFQDGVGFTSTLAKSDDCCSCCIFWGISSFQLMFSVLANPPPSKPWPSVLLRYTKYSNPADIDLVLRVHSQQTAFFQSFAHWLLTPTTRRGVGKGCDTLETFLTSLALLYFSF